jgi:hypothetical protein
MDDTFCAFSLSEDGDLLSQWRGYCPQQGGYSLGFSTAPMQDRLQLQGFALLRCEYDRAKQSARIKPLLDAALAKFRQVYQANEPVLDGVKRVVPQFARASSRVAAILKDPSFSEEREWRIVSTGPISPDRLEYRIRGSIAIPHCALSICEEIAQLPLTEIVVGPSFNQQLAIDGLQVLLSHCGIDNLPTIRPSRIPYRSFS